jgi:hypothetical protein
LGNYLKFKELRSVKLQRNLGEQPVEIDKLFNRHRKLPSAQSTYNE